MPVRKTRTTRECRLCFCAGMLWLQGAYVVPEEKHENEQAIEHDISDRCVHDVQHLFKKAPVRRSRLREIGEK